MHKATIKTGFTQEECIQRVKTVGQELGFCVDKEYKDGEDVVLVLGECLQPKPRLFDGLLRAVRRWLPVFVVLSILATAGCGTTDNARIAGLLMGTSTEEAKKHLKALGRVPQCYESYNVSISGHGTRKATIWYDCPREVK